MPLKEGKSKKTIGFNIKEMFASPTFAKGKSNEKKMKMAQAAAYKKARESKR